MRSKRTRSGLRACRAAVILSVVLPQWVTAAPPASAACIQASTETDKARMAVEIYRNADIIVAGRVLKRLDITGGHAEVLRVDRLIKGRSPKTISLWLPKKEDYLNTNESPTTGLAVGKPSIFPLRWGSGKAHGALILFECDAIALIDKQVSDKIRQYRAEKLPHVGD